jgi:hypothetical protein
MGISLMLALKSHLNWQSLLHDNTDDSDNGCACLGFLGCCNTDRDNAICVEFPKDAKASTTAVAVIGVFPQQT